MKRRRQPGLWAPPPTRAQIDSHRLDVGDRVWCAGRPYVVEYVNEDGSVGIVYDRPRQKPNPGTASP